jgi:hypothetical protein
MIGENVLVRTFVVASLFEEACAIATLICVCASVSMPAWCVNPLTVMVQQWVGGEACETWRHYS